MPVKAAKKNFLEKIIPIPQSSTPGTRMRTRSSRRSRSSRWRSCCSSCSGARSSRSSRTTPSPVVHPRVNDPGRRDYGAPSWNCTPMMADYYYAALELRHVQAPRQGAERDDRERRRAFNPMGGHDDPGMSGPTSGAAWRYYPSRGPSPTPRAPWGRRFSTNNPRRRRGSDGEDRGSVCGQGAQRVRLDGTLQYVYRDRADMIKSDEWTHDTSSRT